MYNNYTPLQQRQLALQEYKLVICMMGEEGSLCYDGERYHRFGIVPCDHLVAAGI